MTEMLEKAVMSVATAEKLGTVSDAIIDPDHFSLIGLVLGTGVLAKEGVLPFEDVQRIGRDAVLARSAEHLVTPRGWRETDMRAVRATALRGRRVITAAGEEVGYVSDVFFDEADGGFAGLEVESRTFAGLRRRRTVIAHEAIPRIGVDAVVVSEQALAAARQDTVLTNRDGIVDVDPRPTPEEGTNSGTRGCQSQSAGRTQHQTPCVNDSCVKQ